MYSPINHTIYAFDGCTVFRTRTGNRVRRLLPRDDILITFCQRDPWIQDFVCVAEEGTGREHRRSSR